MRTVLALVTMVVATGLLAYSVSDVRLVRFRGDVLDTRFIVDIGIFERLVTSGVGDSVDVKTRLSNNIDDACPKDDQNSASELDRESCLANKATAGLLLAAGGLGVIAFAFTVLGMCCCQCKGCSVFLLSVSTLLTTGGAVVYGVLVYPNLDAFTVGVPAPNQRFDFGYYFMCVAAFFYLCSAALLSGSNNRPPPKRQPYYSRF